MKFQPTTAKLSPTAFNYGAGLALALDARGQNYSISATLRELEEGLAEARAERDQVMVRHFEEQIRELKKDNPELAKDMADRPHGQRVKIKQSGGMKEFHGKTGTIIGKEGNAYRVHLDEPVEIPGVGKVKDDLWEPSLLSRIGGG